MAIATSKTREQFPLSPKKVLKKTIAGALAWSLVLLISYSIFAFVLTSAKVSFSKYFNLSPINFMGIIIFIILITYLYEKWYFNVYFYDLTQDYIVIKKGPITPHEISIPYERVQDVYVDQDILDRILGLYDVHLSTATYTSGMEAHIDGVAKNAADGLKSNLLDTIGKKIQKKSTTIDQSPHESTK